MNLLTVHLQAHDPLVKIRRSYTLWLGQDLFGDWSVTTVRSGACKKGITTVYAYPDPEQACRKFKALLKRRASAPRRLGFPYQVVHYECFKTAFLSAYALREVEHQILSFAFV